MLTVIEILRIDIKPLEHRKRPVYGYITSRDGDYLMVRPTWCKWEIELYPNEVRLCE
jgi:hypothetical protein